MKTNKVLLFLVIVQIIAVFIAFYHELLYPNTYSLYDMHDGLKNYFTYYSYIIDIKNNSYSLFENMNYPFGEIYLYTDNTPILSLSLKILSKLGIDFTDSAFLIHHLFFISGILISTILLYFILRKFIEKKIIILIASLSLPWICPQYLKITGYFALSLSSILLWTIWLLQIQFDSVLRNNNKRLWGIACIQIITMFFSIFIHLYYLPSLAITIICFWFFYMLSKRNRQSAQVFIQSCLIVGISFVLSYIFIITIDVYKNYREPGATGYDWINWKLRWENLFHKYDFLTITFPYNYKQYLGMETNAYLGSFALYGTFLIPFFLFYCKEKFANGKFLPYLLFASLVLLIISFGEQIPIGETGKTFTNYLNPFYYIHLISPIVTQFRCLGRFGWLFFWSYNFIILYTLDRVLTYTKNRFIKSCLYFVIVLCLFDAIDTIKSKSKDLHFNMLANKEMMSDMTKLTKGIDFSKYQAILPIPFYHVGYENSDYIIDPDDEHCTRTYQLSILTKLPLMSSKLSRTPGNSTKGLLGIFTEKDIPDIVKNRLNTKPILIYIDWVTIHNGYKPTNINTLSIYNKFIPFLERNQFRSISKFNQYELLEWVR